ncbi:MAG TPA: GGDEF domain-containing protein [Dyella sp.]|uniref:tetratricopeptide repeat-containing diguanylate cyclase n=1 Tax=Dyella sp. TaxID=1869338 RepID=UPI002D1A1E02|nr:GGDEF domain-containing protein [Dyella sp.]HTV86818.1 GGDEF domain-containing protein [Dyella sp.]
MNFAVRRRPKLAAGLGLLLGLLSGAVAAAAAPQPVDPGALLAHADSIKTSDYAGFVKLLDQINHSNLHLSEDQKWYLRYLNGWEVAYSGDENKAKAALEAVIDGAPQETLKMHATANLINILGVGHHYEEAFSRLDQALDYLPHVTDKDARFHLLGEAAQLLMQAGQYDLASTYADQILLENPQGRNGCIGMYIKGHAEFLRDNLQLPDTHYQEGIAVCEKVHENLIADSIRRDVANAYLQQGKVTEAIALLQSRYPHVLSYQYLDLDSEYDALLAQAYWKINDTQRAEKYALDTVDIATKSDFTEPLSLAYQLLYQIEQQKGDMRDALAYHEKYMSADKVHLDDIREKALAYQIVKQQVEAKKVQLEALHKQNQILQLQQALNIKQVEAGRLYIALLLTVLASIGLWLYRLKRSQLRFMRLARRDGLTGIFNRQHFVDEAEQALHYSAKSSRGACLILIDMDHFKLINDTHGHLVGDQVLKHAVTTCQGHLHSCDVFGRLGGEEFGILLPECTPSKTLDRAEQIRQAINAISEWQSLSLTISASFGIAATEHHGYELRSLLIAADDALYRAKRNGRNRVVMNLGASAPSPAASPQDSRPDTPVAGQREAVRTDPASEWERRATT